MILSRRAMLGGMASLAAAPASAADYVITPAAIGDGIWMVRGADEPIEAHNGGAIANIAIIATPAGTVLWECGPSLRYARACGRWPSD